MANLDQRIKRFFDIGMNWGFQLAEEYEATFKAMRDSFPFDLLLFPIVCKKSNADPAAYRELGLMLSDKKNDIFLRSEEKFAPHIEEINSKMPGMWLDNLATLMLEHFKNGANAKQCYDTYQQFFQKGLASPSAEIRKAITDISSTYFGNEDNKEFYFKRMTTRFFLDNFVDGCSICTQCGYPYPQNSSCQNSACSLNCGGQSQAQSWGGSAANSAAGYGGTSGSQNNVSGFAKIILALVIAFFLFAGAHFFLTRNYLGNKVRIVPDQNEESRGVRQTFPFDGRIRGTRVNIRTGPTKGAKSYGLFNNGFRVRVIEISGSWCKVEFRNSNGKTNVGWVHKDYVTR
jgi:hypothetical protein